MRCAFSQVMNVCVRFFCWNFCENILLLLNVFYRFSYVNPYLPLRCCRWFGRNRIHCRQTMENWNVLIRMIWFDRTNEAIENDDIVGVAYSDNNKKLRSQSLSHNDIHASPLTLTSSTLSLLISPLFPPGSLFTSTTSNTHPSKMVNMNECISFRFLSLYTWCIVLLMPIQLFCVLCGCVVHIIHSQRWL